MLPLVLASSSPYRREILTKLGLPFECYSPEIDESALSNELPIELVKRLAIQKAQAVATQYPKALIIGSDQVAVLDNIVMTKPHTYANAIKQLQASSGQEVTFLTSLCLFNSLTNKHQVIVSPYSVEFLSLTDQQIEHYLLKEQPYNCAGSFKSEGLGITLFKRFKGDDPNSLIGLPLIELTQMLRAEGVEPLSSTL